MSHTKNTCPGCNVVTTCRCKPRDPSSIIETTNRCATCVERVNEDAAAGAISAGSVAGFRGSLFGGSMPRRQRNTVSGIPVIRYNNTNTVKSRVKPKRKLAEAAQNGLLAFLNEAGSNGDDDSDFDSADVISKLSRNAQVSDELDGDELAVFGLEDKDGQITKVYVPAEQGKDFEKALGEALRTSKENGPTEIAALLFELKDKFKIIDVKWPAVQEDEEQIDPNAPPGAAGPADPNVPPPGMDPNAPPGAEGGMPPMDGEMPPGEGPAAPGADSLGGAGEQDMIAQILDMLKADAAARMADAKAKTAEANAKEAESASKLAAIKMQGEEGALDAEAYFKAKKEEKKEGDRMKMMARYRQETQQDDDDVEVHAPAPQQAPTPSATPRRDEEEEQMSNTRKHLLSILNRGR